MAHTRTADRARRASRVGASPGPAVARSTGGDAEVASRAQRAPELHQPEQRAGNPLHDRRARRPQLRDRHRDLRHGVSAALGAQHELGVEEVRPVPARPHRVAEHTEVEHLHPVRVRDREPEAHPQQAGEDGSAEPARGAAGVGCAGRALGPDHDHGPGGVRRCVEQLERLLHELEVPEVDIEDHRDVAARLQQAGPQCLAVVRGPHGVDLDLGRLERDPGRDRGRAVGRAVLDDVDLELVAERAQSVDHRAHGRSEQRGFVVGRDDDRDHGASIMARGDRASRYAYGASSVVQAPVWCAARPQSTCTGVQEEPFVAAMPDVLKLNADGSADRLAVIVDASHGAHFSTTTFAELNALVNRLAHGLRALGAEQGDRIVWCGPNSLETIAVVHAARKAGLVAVPLSYRFTAEEMAYVIDNSDATLVVVDADYAELVDSVRDRIPKVRACVGYCATVERKELPADMVPWADVLA